MNNTNLPVDFHHIVERARLILTCPDTCWDTISTESKSPKEILIGYVLPFAVVGALCYFISFAIFGFYTPLGTMRTPIVSTLISAIIMCVLSPVSILVFGWIANKAAPHFGGTSDFNRALALVAYSMTPGFLGSIFIIVPFIGKIAGLIGIYGLYIFFRGTTKMLAIPDEKKLFFTVVTLVVAAIAMGLIGLLSTPFQPGSPL